MSGKKNIGSFRIGWRSPSNIALVKYWGKKPVQIPANPSLSMTLSQAYTEMTIDFNPKDTTEEKPWLEFTFEGARQEKFEKKIEDYLHTISSRYPVLSRYRYIISSRNTFPHSTGIASSASSMSALGLCLAEFLSGSEGREFSYQEASCLSRLASGSACRSVYGGYVIWGETRQMPGTSDEFAVPVPFAVHPAFREMNDAILVVSSTEKKISSRAGHSLMDGHPYAEARYEMAVANLSELARALETGDFDTFIRITESEALNLHALMMTSRDSYLLFEPNTLNIVNTIRNFRIRTNLPVCFTLDAGPNVHLLYPAPFETIVKNWINEELVRFCENGKWIDDKLGTGPEKI